MTSVTAGPWPGSEPPEPSGPDPADDETVLSLLREDDSKAAMPVWVAFDSPLGDAVTAAFADAGDAARYSDEFETTVMAIPLYRKGEYPWPAPTMPPRLSPSS